LCLLKIYTFVILQRRNSFNQGRRRVSGRSLKAQREDSIRRTVYVSDIDQHVSELRMAWIKFYLDFVCLVHHISTNIGYQRSITTLLLYLGLGLTDLAFNQVKWHCVNCNPSSRSHQVALGFCCCSLFSVLFQSW